MTDRPVSELTDEELQAEAAALGVQVPSGIGSGAQAGLNISPSMTKLLGFIKSLEDEAGDSTDDDVKNIIVGAGRELADNILNAPIVPGVTQDSPFNLPRPDTNDIIAGAKAVPQFMADRQAQARGRAQGNLGRAGDANVISGDIPGLGDRFGQERLLLDLRDFANSKVNPISTGVGEVVGDVATLALAKKPRIRRMGATQAAERTALSNSISKRLPGITGPQLEAVVRRELDDVGSRLASFLFTNREVVNGKLLSFSKGAAAGLKRGFGKSAEVGLEAGMLAILDGEDPLALAAFGAGTQATGSLGLTLLSTKTGKGLAAALAGMFAVSQLIEGLGPESNDFFKSTDFAQSGLVTAFSLGLLGAVTGGGRFRSASQERLPVFFDALTQFSRTGTREIFSEMIDSSDEGTPAFLVLKKMATNPDFFNNNQTNSLARAFSSGKPGAFTKEVERLLKDSPDFREKVGDL